jgi:hypothetical protein
LDCIDSNRACVAPSAVPHLFVDISSHGFGHLGQTAPVLDALHRIRPDVRVTIRSGLPMERLKARIAAPFDHLHRASDFGFAMKDALAIDHAATLARYAGLHDDWTSRVAEEAAFLASIGPDRVFSNVSYLPLAGAAKCGIPAAAMCSLNWGDLFAHFYGDGDERVRRIHAQIAAAYRHASFLSLEPGMPFPGHPDRLPMPPVAIPGKPGDLGIAADDRRTRRRVVLVAFGGIPIRFPVERWAGRDDILWLVPADWTDALAHPACRSLESLNVGFSDLLARVDAIITKPGYGTFVEAAMAGTPVLYLRRDWPEQEPLIEWLHRNVAARELPPSALAAGAVDAELDALWRQDTPPRPPVDGAEQVAKWIDEWLAGPRPGPLRT